MKTEGKLSSVMLTPEEAAKRLGLKNSDTLAVWRCTKRYDLPYVKVGRLVRYRESDVEAFLTRHTSSGIREARDSHVGKIAKGKIRKIDDDLDAEIGHMGWRS